MKYDSNIYKLKFACWWKFCQVLGRLVNRSFKLLFSPVRICFKCICFKVSLVVLSFRIWTVWKATSQPKCRRQPDFFIKTRNFKLKSLHWRRLQKWPKVAWVTWIKFFCQIFKRFSLLKEKPLTSLPVEPFGHIHDCLFYRHHPHEAWCLSRKNRLEHFGFVVKS